MQAKPFTVIGGFLGAGKTTLVNRVLLQSEGVRYAVLVNDFGDLAIDKALIAAHDGQTVALANGCICCTMSDGFISAMLTLMSEPDRFDHVLVEASGVSEPDRIMDFARLDPSLSPDAILVLADAETLSARLTDRHVGQVVRRQIESADLLLLTKADLIDERRFEEAKASVQSINKAATVLPSANGDLPLGVVLGISVNAADRVATEHPQYHNLHAHHHAADEVFHTETVSLSMPVERKRFDAFCDALPASVIRGKGFVRFREDPTKTFNWQKVGARSELALLSNPVEQTNLVLIASEPFSKPTL